MGKAEVGTPKYVANQMKARGLQKLKWYCQVCEKQCRDDNGFKCHIRSESHLKRIQNVDKSTIQDFSKQFQDHFVSMLKNYHGTKTINANKFYNQVIQQKDHVHLNATKWGSLTQFLKDAQSKGLIKIAVQEGSDEFAGLEGVDISYINNSSDEILRQKSLQLQQESTRSDEQLEMKLLQDQIKRGNAVLSKREEEEAAAEPEEETKPAGPIKIQLKAKPVKLSSFKVSKPVSKPLKQNVFKKR